MSTPIVFNGVAYSVPAYNDSGYAQGAGNLSSYLIALASGTLQQSGGVFSLTADANFGNNFGLVALYYKSTTANTATAGTIRLAKTDTIDWRNNANSANLALGINGSDQLTYNGVVLLTSSSGGFVSSITGTANQIIASSPTGAVTLSTPQDIGTSSSPTFASETLTNTTNQLVLGTTRTVTINAPTPASTSRIVTIPDLSAAYSVVGTEGNQTINGVKTFAGANAYGTPASIVLTNGTGLPLTTGVTGVLPIANGGTNSSTALSGSSIAISNGTAIVQGAAGTTTTVLHGNAGGAPTYSAVSLTADVSNTLPVANGGTGNTTFTAYSIIAAGTTATGPFQNVSGVGTSGQVLTSNGAAALPTWQTLAGTGTVNSGTAGNLALYPTSTNAVSDTYTVSAKTTKVSVANGGFANRVYNLADLSSSVSPVTYQVILSTGDSSQTITPGLVLQNGASNATLELYTNVAGNSSTIIQSGVAAGATHRICTVPDPGANANFVMSEGTATINGVKTFATQGIIHGTSTNDAAAAGFVGELIETQQTTGVTAAASGSLKEVANIVLSAGDWDMTGVVVFEGQGGATSFTALGNFELAISTTSASTSGSLQGYNYVRETQQTTSTSAYRTLVIPTNRASITGSTTYYLNASTVYTSTTPKIYGTISARRIR